MRSPLKLMDWSYQLTVWILVALTSVSPPMLAEGLPRPIQGDRHSYYLGRAMKFRR
jgi:hypothetical protein